MAKFIGVKMIEAVPMTANEANDKGHKIGNHSFEEDGYEVTYPDGYKSWSPAKEFEKAYYKLEDPAGDILYVKLALIELALLNLMISLEPLRVLRTLRYTPRRGWNGSYASNISIVINDNDYID